MLLLVEDGTWRPGLGDPTFMGWLTVVVYFLTAWLCLRVFRRLQHRVSEVPTPVRLWWLGLTVALFALGINKQLDLQTLLTQIGKSLAREQGWYADRRAIQQTFIVVIGLAAAGGTAALMYALRRWLRQLWVGIVGFGLLLGFVVIRAASFHHVDHLLGVRILALRFNWLMELGSLALIARAAIRFGGLPKKLPDHVRSKLPARRHRNRLGREEVPIKVKVRSLPSDTDKP